MVKLVILLLMGHIVSKNLLTLLSLTYSQTPVPRIRMAQTDLKVRSIFPIFLSKKNLGALNSDGLNIMDGSN
jgi:hypothetical protein